MGKKRFVAEEFAQNNKPIHVLDEAVRKLAQNANAPSRQKTLILCIDGISPDKVRVMIERGQLPAFKQLIERGTSGRMRSTIPPDSLPAWPSFTTGQNPAKHGITAYFKTINGRKTAINATMIDSRRYWDICSDAGLNSVVMNLPTTYPPSQIKGIMISDYLSPAGQNFTYPESLCEPLKQIGYFTELAGTRFFDYDMTSPEPYLYKIDRTLEAALSIMRNYPWDVFTLCFISPDKAHHVMGLDSGSIDTVYKKIDESIARLLSSIDQERTDIFVVSDHGAENYEKEFALHPWLYEQGLLRLNSLQEQMSHTNNAGRHSSGQADPGLLRRAFLSCLGFAYRLKVSLNLPSLPFFHFPKEVIDEHSDDPCPFDWHATKAYSMLPPTSNYLPVFINTRGERPSGIVDKGDEYAQVKAGLVRGFNELRDPQTNAKIVTRIYDRSELFSGRFLPDMPDIVVELDKRYIGFSGYTDRNRIKHGPVFKTFDSPVVDHSIDAVFIFSGPNARQNNTIDPVSIVDMMPTILYSRGLPVPDDTDGTVTRGIFADGFSAQTQVIVQAGATQHAAGKERWVSKHSAKDLERINNELKRMGYIK